MYRQNLEVIDIPQLASLTALTALSPDGIVLDRHADMRPVRKTNLIQLTLEDCLGVAGALFVPGALSSLKRLCLYESEEYILDDQGDVIHMDEASEDDLSVQALEVQELGRVTFGHPSLAELSGATSIVSLNIQDKNV